MSQNLVTRAVNYSFRAPTDKAVASAKAAGQPVPIKRAPVELQVPALTQEGIQEILNSGSAQAKAFLLEVVNAVFVNYVQEKFEAQPRSEEINVSLIDMSDVDWEKIANLPPDERKSRGIPEELWTMFTDDYKSIMPAITGRPMDRIENHCKFFVARFSALRSNKPMVTSLLGLLDQWAQSTDKLEECAPIYAALTAKGKAILEANESEQVNNLL